MAFVTNIRYAWKFFPVKTFYPPNARDCHKMLIGDGCPADFLPYPCLINYYLYIALTVLCMFKKALSLKI